MLVITVIDFDSGKTLKWHGEKHDLLKWLHDHFPEYREMDSVDDIVEAMNEDGFYKAGVKPLGRGSNLLPEGYHTSDQSDDPWPRESDPSADDDSD